MESVLVNMDEKDYLVSELDIKALGWTLLLLSPLQERQKAIKQSFIFNLSMAFIGLVLISFILYMLFKRVSKGLEKNIHIDPLTRLANRTRTQHYFEQFRQQQVGLGLILIDLDHFKSVNDSYGHNGGDTVLVHVADLLSEGIRDGDVVGRWGGEEFIILLPGATLELAMGAAERIREQIENAEIETEQGKVKVTASFGVTCAKKYHALTSLVAQADKALYQAKENGRNQVCRSLNQS